MPVMDSMRDTLDQLRAQERKLTDELNGLRFTIKNLERIAGIESADAAPVEALAEIVPSNARPEMTASNGSVGKTIIRPDEFFGLTHAEAARRYLKRVGHAVSFGEMVDVLRRGGCKLTSADPEHVLWISLVKNSKDFVPPQAGYVGLREFYPARARALAEKTKAKTAKKRKKNKATAKREPKITKEPQQGKTDTQPNEEKSNEVGKAVRDFMSDKQPHSAADIAKAVSEKLGRVVKVIAIRGTLNSKKHFEVAGGKFRLIG